MTTLKVWCLPDGLTEASLISLFEELLSAVKKIPEAGVKSERDITILFPANRMKWGLGKDIVAEITNLPAAASMHGIRQRIVMEVGSTLMDRFSDAKHIRCTAEAPNPATAVWICLPSNFP